MAQNLRHYWHYLIYGASKADLVVIDCVDCRDITIDATSYDKISKDERHPLYPILPTVKHSFHRLRRKTFQLPFIVNTKTPAF